MVFGCTGTKLTPDERQFFEKSNPFGFILFQRNCVSPEQVHTLIRELRLIVNDEDAPVFIDQEGGRVARLKPPNWSKYPAAQIFGDIYDQDAELGVEAMRCYTRLVANELHKLGFTVNCAPVVDLHFKDASSAIGDRAINRKPTVVAELARLQAETFLENGILPVIKHFPGHGRLKTDPHDVLPTIDATRAELENDDFVPFELLKDLPLGMNSHAIFSALDPNNPASLSSYVYNGVIRGRLGFDGLLFSDDICMKALRGTPPELAKKVQAAGADVILHCNAALDEMKAVANALQPIKDETMARWARALSMRKLPSEPYNPVEDLAQLDLMLGGIAFDAKSIG